MLDHLALHANWNLSPTILTYGRFFQNLRIFPEYCLWPFAQRRVNLAGDFTIRIHNTSFKGSLLDFKIKDKNGQLNLLTNKFNLGGWRLWSRPARGVLSGDMKVFLNLKGDFRNPSALERMMNITGGTGAITRKEGAQIEKSYGTWFGSGGSWNQKAGHGNLRVSDLIAVVFHNLGTDHPSMKGQFNSKSLEIHKVFAKVQTLSFRGSGNVASL